MIEENQQDTLNTGDSPRVAETRDDVVKLVQVVEEMLSPFDAMPPSEIKEAYERISVAIIAVAASVGLLHIRTAAAIDKIEELSQRVRATERATKPVGARSKASVRASQSPRQASGASS